MDEDALREYGAGRKSVKAERGVGEEPRRLRGQYATVGERAKQYMGGFRGKADPVSVPPASSSVADTGDPRPLLWGRLRGSVPGRRESA